jgi:hypothetical protein
MKRLMKKRIKDSVKIKKSKWQTTRKNSDMHKMHKITIENGQNR